MSSKRFYSLATEGREAELVIFGDITSFEWLASDRSAYTIHRELQELDVDTINVRISSYGGEVGEGLAIFNSLKNHKAKIRTIVDGFACSIASVIFLAGDERLMNEASLLMIHNAWTYAAGNSTELRKMADDLETITEQSKTIYLSKSNIDKETLTELMDNESWITPEDAVSMGFATAIIGDNEEDNPSQSARMAVIRKLTSKDEMSELMEELKSIKAMLSKDETSDEDNPEIDPEAEETEAEEDTEAEAEETEAEDETSDDDEEDETSSKQKWLNFFSK